MIDEIPLKLGTILNKPFKSTNFYSRTIKNLTCYGYTIFNQSCRLLYKLREICPRKATVYV